MPLQLTFTKRYQAHYKNLTEHEKQLVARKLALLSENPLHPSLRTKRIRGTEYLYEASVNMDIRMIWHYEAETLIMLVDIGHHDILCNY